MLRFLAPLAIFAILGVVFVMGLRSGDPGEIPSPLLSKPLPAFTLARVLDPSEQVSSEVMLGAPALLNVWGSWCVNCAVEHDFLMRLADSGRIRIFGLNWNDERANAQQWLADRGDPYQFSAHDAEGRVAIDLGVYGAPETFLVDANGTIVHKHIGPLTDTIWQDDFLPRLEALSQ
ncbi:MAG: DsbE family thiol:disulfide interchange protein [Pseudomonadota bacterium]